MAMKIKFANDTEIEYLEAYEGPEFFDGASRRVLKVITRPGIIGLDALNTILSTEANCSQLTLTNESPDVNDPTALPIINIYDHYQLKMSIGQEPMVVGENAETGEQVKEDRIVFKLGRLTPIEIKLKQLGL